MPKGLSRPRRSKAETETLRANIARMAADGMLQRQIASKLGVSQAAVSQALKLQRGGLSRAPREPQRAPKPATGTSSSSSQASPRIVPGVATRPPGEFYAHVVDSLEQTIDEARESRHYSAVASLRARQVSAYEMLTTVRGETNELEGLTEDDLIGVLRDELAGLPEELRDLVLAPSEVVPLGLVRSDNPRSTG